MKKSLLIGLLLVGTTYSLFAQLERMPFGEKSTYTLSKKINTNGLKNSSSTKQNIIFDDFEGSSYNLQDNWEIKRGSLIDLGQLTDANDPKWFLCKPTSFNGNGSNYIYNGDQSVAISYNAPDATWLIRKDTIDVPTDNTLYLKFWLWYYSNYNQGYVTHFDIFVYDVNSQTIDSLKSWGDYDTTSVTNQFANRIILPLTKYAGKSIRIAFVYTNHFNENKGSQLAIDDFTIADDNNPDLDIAAIPFSYSNQPSFMSDSLELELLATITNQGSALEDTAEVSVTSPQLPDFSTILQITDTLNAGETRTVKLPNKIKFKTAGTYSIFFETTAEQDLNEGNNTDSLEFVYSDNLFSTDHGVVGGFSLGKDKEFGNVYKVTKDAFIGGVQIEWPQFNNTKEFTPFDFQVRIYELNPIDNSIKRMLYNEFQTKTAESSGVYVNYQLDEPIFCNHNMSYLVTVTQVGVEPLGIGYDGYDEGSFWKLNQSDWTIERMANPTIGNVALRLTMVEPEEHPLITFTVKNSDDLAAENVDIYIPELDSTLTTNASGVATIALDNGYYSFSIDTLGFAPIKEDFKVFSRDLFFDINLAKPFWVKFAVTNESDEPVAGAEIIIADSVLVTDATGVDSLQLAPDDYDFYVMASGYQKYDWGFLEHEAKDTLMEVQLIAATTYNLTIEVINEKDEVMPNTEVGIMDYGVKQTNSEGKVTFTGISDTDITVIAWKYNYWINFKDVELVKDSTIQIELFAERYNATFYVTSHGNPIPDAEIIVEGIDTVNTELNGYALVNFIPFGNDIPYTVKYNGYHTYSGTFNIDNMDVRVDVSLIPTAVDPVTSNSVNIYPNPSNGEFKVKADGRYSIMIFDIAGRIVYQNNLCSDETPININEKSSGIYIVRIIGEQGITTRRIIKR